MDAGSPALGGPTGSVPAPSSSAPAAAVVPPPRQRLTEKTPEELVSKKAREDTVLVDAVEVTDMHNNDEVLEREALNMMEDYLNGEYEDDAECMK